MGSTQAACPLASRGYGCRMYNPAYMAQNARLNGNDRHAACTNRQWMLCEAEHGVVRVSEIN